MDNPSFFTLEGAAVAARSLTAADARTYVVVEAGDEPNDPMAGPWRVLPAGPTLDLAHCDTVRVLCSRGTLQHRSVERLRMH